MKKLGFVLFMLAMALMLTGNALAQNVGDNSVYFVTYYSNANTAGAPDGVVRAINDGDKQLRLLKAWKTGHCGLLSTSSTTAKSCSHAALVW